MMCSTEINLTLKWRKIVKFQWQNLVDNSKTFSKCTYSFRIEKELTELRSSKVGAIFRFEDSIFVKQYE